MDSERVLREERWKKFVLEQWIYDLYKKKKVIQAVNQKNLVARPLGEECRCLFWTSEKVLSRREVLEKMVEVEVTWSNNV
jgi:hypothetical protein